MQGAKVKFGGGSAKRAEAGVRGRETIVVTGQGKCVRGVCYVVLVPCACEQRVAVYPGCKSSGQGLVGVV